MFFHHPSGEAAPAAIVSDTPKAPEAPAAILSHAEQSASSDVIDLRRASVTPPAEGLISETPPIDTAQHEQSVPIDESPTVEHAESMESAPATAEVQADSDVEELLAAIDKARASFDEIEQMAKSLKEKYAQQAKHTEPIAKSSEAPSVEPSSEMPVAVQADETAASETANDASVDQPMKTPTEALSSEIPSITPQQPVEPSAPASFEMSEDAPPLPPLSTADAPHVEVTGTGMPATMGDKTSMSDGDASGEHKIAINF